MKNFYIVLAVLAVLVSAIFCYITNQKYMLANAENLIYKSEIKWLQEDLSELKYKQLTAKTYDQGYQDALIDTKLGTYAKGFAAAENLYKDKSYSDGYHAAIQQNWTLTSNPPLQPEKPADK